MDTLQHVKEAHKEATLVLYYSYYAPMMSLKCRQEPDAMSQYMQMT